MGSVVRLIFRQLYQLDVLELEQGKLSAINFDMLRLYSYHITIAPPSSVLNRFVDLPFVQHFFAKRSTGICIACRLKCASCLLALCSCLLEERLSNRAYVGTFLIPALKLLPAFLHLAVDQLFFQIPSESQLKEPKHLSQVERRPFSATITWTGSPLYYHLAAAGLLSHF